MVGTKRAANRATMTAQIQRLGREHLSIHGAAGLSLRAIARDLGVVSSAVYRYVPSRDDLLTLRLVEAYNDLADTVESALDGTARDGGALDGDAPQTQLRSAALAMRRWADANPARWALLYVSPVPGYAAPSDQTVGPGTRAIRTLLVIVENAQAAGLLRSDLPAPTRGLEAELAVVGAEFGLRLSPAAIAAATSLWATIIGAISLDVFGQYGSDSFAQPEELFTGQIDLVLSAILR